MHINVECASELSEMSAESAERRRMTALIERSTLNGKGRQSVRKGLRREETNLSAS